MSDQLKGKTIAFLGAPEGIEQVELTDPWKASDSVLLDARRQVCRCVRSPPRGTVTPGRRAD